MAVDDPEGGIIRYTYGPFGGLRTATTPAGAVTLTERDAFGRVRREVSPDREELRQGLLGSVPDRCLCGHETRGAGSYGWTLLALDEWMPLFEIPDASGWPGSDDVGVARHRHPLTHRDGVSRRRHLPVPAGRNRKSALRGDAASPAHAGFSASPGAVSRAALQVAGWSSWDAHAHVRLRSARVSGQHDPAIHPPQSMRGSHRHRCAT
ncbi:uncharacterized protein CMC5_048030 [Chondromyces crocatus]|uniref:RHS repeat-associated core domain-containing protein n=1 Tax=Chondromyces crocatus TaxID=52 RepID=A0A0K1EJ03_CHOCO|nr:uncharacterized protein CMC5_048030 [Chondromyces crocatus]